MLPATMLLSVTVWCVVLVAVAEGACLEYASCVSCTEGGSHNECMWSGGADGSCIDNTPEKRTNIDDFVRWNDRCQVERVEDADDASFLGNWMGKLAGSGIFSRLSLLDLSLPGTHDTLTYDLSLTVSDGGADDDIRFAEVMHKYGKLVPDSVEDFIRQQAQTQGLTVTEQLNNGIRFLDLRTMYEYSDKVNPEWYSLHFLQSNKKMLAYLQEIRDWMEQHPSEVVVMWMSKHGSSCVKGNSQYPNTPIAIKQKFFKKIETIFDGMLLHGKSPRADSSPVRLNETTVAEMVDRNARAVFYVSDWSEMTQNSTQVLDGCLIDNRLGPSVNDEQNSVEWEQNLYKSAVLEKWRDKKEQKLMLMSLSTGVPSIQTVAEGDIRFLHHNDQNTGKIDEKIMIDKCTKAFNIPDFDSWCPPTLLDIANLENYYKQLTMDQVYKYKDLGWAFPNAIYINGVDMGGTIRTGTQVFWQDGSNDSSSGNNNDGLHTTTKYAYVDTIIGFNLFVACNSDVVHDQESPEAQQCASMKSIVEARRAKFPVTTWEDLFHGRHTDWPTVPERGI